jgi:hypothetical protein
MLKRKLNHILFPCHLLQFRKNSLSNIKFRAKKKRRKHQLTSHLKKGMSLLGLFHLMKIQITEVTKDSAIIHKINRANTAVALMNKREI